uniref:Selection and upkeep of intraepithelial T-cells protein 1 homolog isoform X2 n=1 Tax=Geotrypetes seraphini TaxID=260995 RepID=A0A6P8PEI2_GEOSA|nr:putative selection and upkeep of intraepithelial T-cells protein 1 homolog isoform X2 [Geotrypetes seraphini]
MWQQSPHSFLPGSPWRMCLSSLPGFILLWISHHFQTGNAVTEDFKVIGPDQPVVAVLGEDAVLPCNLIPASSAEDMRVRWYRTQFDSVVHLQENGVDQKQHQIPEYRGRTELLINHISNGSVLLRIRNITLSDEGNYTCFIRIDPHYKEATVELKVASLGHVSSISVNDHQDRGIMVLFESSGWYPEPEVTWRQEDGQSLMPASETETQEQNGLFKIKTSLHMRTNLHGKVSCHIRNTLLNQERELVISKADLFYQRVSRWVIFLIILLISVIILCGLLAVLGVYLLRKERQEKAKLSADVDKLSADNEKLSAENENLSADNESLHSELGKFLVSSTVKPCFAGGAVEPE